MTELTKDERQKLARILRPAGTYGGYTPMQGAIDKALSHIDAQAQRIEELEAENRDLRAGLFSCEQGGFRVRGVVERYVSERTGEVADEEAQDDE